ncbi:MAG TPA: cellulose synthase operon protein YhjQ/BcsQ [Actinomycetes bacterium]
MAFASRPDRPPLLVIAHDDAGTADALRHAAETAGWRVAVAQPGAAGLTAALAARPAVALVGCAVLGDLPAGARVPVLGVGDDTRPAHLRAVVDAGAAGLVSWPDGAADLAAELARVAATGTASDQAAVPVVAVAGVHGGAGATTVAVHLAGAWARWGPAPVLAVDLAGGLAFRLDLVMGAWTWVDVTRAASGLDGPSLLHTLSQPWPDLSVLPLTGLADGVPARPPEPEVVQAALEAARTAFRVVVLDLPAATTPAATAALAAADVLLAVSRPESAGIRGLHATFEQWEAAGHDPAAAGAVVTGMRARAPLAGREVRGALGDRLWSLVPAAAPELAAAAEDGVILLDRPDLPAVQAMLTLANRLLPFPATTAARR